MNKPELNTVKVSFNSVNKIEIEVRFKDVDVELAPGGLGFLLDSGRKKLMNGWNNFRYKLVKKEDYILLQHTDTGGKTIVSSKAYDYITRYPIYGENVDKVYEQYGKLFNIEADGKNIKLFPVYVDETKQVRSEIEKAIERYMEKTA